jgi:hypothetical protein
VVATTRGLHVSIQVRAELVMQPTRRGIVVGSLLLLRSGDLGVYVFRFASFHTRCQYRHLDVQRGGQRKVPSGNQSRVRGLVHTWRIG